MVTALIQESLLAELPRRGPTTASLDARLSVWGQAARDAVARRADALIEGAVLYVDKVARNAEVLKAGSLDPAEALLDTEYAALVELAVSLLPKAVKESCRLLWVDQDRLREKLAEALGPSIEAARAEVRRRQALYRRRARLWQNDPLRLAQLRTEIEELRVPRCSEIAQERIARGLLEHHRQDASLGQGSDDAQIEGKLKVRPGTLSRWIAQLDEVIEGGSGPARPVLRLAE